MSGNFLGPPLGTRVKTMHEQELEAAVAEERERILDRIRNPDDAMVEILAPRICKYRWSDMNDSQKASWREQSKPLLRAIADALEEKDG